MAYRTGEEGRGCISLLIFRSSGLRVHLRLLHKSYSVLLFVSTSSVQTDHPDIDHVVGYVFANRIHALPVDVQ